MTDPTTEQFKDLKERAYAAMDLGDLQAASRDFEQLLQLRPENPSFHYMRGLAEKYARNWAVSLQHNLRAIALAPDGEETQAEHWNAAIAATALSQWHEARRLWKACGINIADGEGPINDNFGVAVVRLNPWHAGETVFMRRIDPVRARLLNVPLPESGHRFGDIVLHDGAATGERWDGDRKVPVFNELQRISASDFQTFTVFIRCDNATDLQALLDATAPGIGHAEDWTSGIAYHCLRCSYGTVHRHSDTPDTAWKRDRDIGIAAQSRHSVEKLLSNWSAGTRTRRVDAIETRECAVPELIEGGVWWRGPEDEEDSESDASREPS